MTQTTEMTETELKFRKDEYTNNEKRRNIYNALAALEGNELDVVMLLISKFTKGHDKYGTWVADNDKRDYKAEAMAELQDFVIYTLMNEVKETT